MFHSAMPTNLYGPGDNYHPKNSHVLPALIRRFHEAKEARTHEVVAWGSGTPRREFLHVDDLADACAFLLGQDNPPDWINVGTGTDVTIRELTEIVAAGDGLHGADLLGRLDARRHAAQAPGRHPSSRPSGGRRGSRFATGWPRPTESFLEEMKSGALRL